MSKIAPCNHPVYNGVGVMAEKTNLVGEMEGIWCSFDDVDGLVWYYQLVQNIPPLVQDPFLVEADIVGESCGYLVNMVVSVEKFKNINTSYL